MWVAHGRYIIENSTILRHDIFSVLKTSELVYPVLTCYLYALLDLVGGIGLVSLFHKFVLVVILYFIYQNSLKNVAYNRLNIFLALISLVGLSLYFIDRPANIALLLLLLAYITIENAQDFTNKDIAKLVILLCMWVNIHGSWPLLLAMLGWKFLFTVSTKNFLRYTLIYAALMLATLINPFGYKVWPYLVETARVSKMRGIDEWNVTSINDYFPHALIFYFICILIMYFIFRKKQLKESKIWTSPVWILIIMGFVAIRNVGFISLVLLPFLYRYGFLTSSNLAQPKKTHLNSAVVVLLIFMCISQLPNIKEAIPDYLLGNKASVYDSSAAQKFVEYIKNTEQTGAILNDWDYGSHLTYSLKNRILWDTRNIIYSQDDFDKFMNIFKGKNPNWQIEVDSYNFQFILVDRKLRQEFIHQISASAQWQNVLESQDTVLFQRK